MSKNFKMAIVCQDYWDCSWELQDKNGKPVIGIERPSEELGEVSTRKELIEWCSRIYLEAYSELLYNGKFNGIPYDAGNLPDAYCDVNNEVVTTMASALYDHYFKAT